MLLTLTLTVRLTPKACRGWRPPRAGSPFDRALAFGQSNSEACDRREFRLAPSASEAKNERAQRAPLDRATVRERGARGRSYCATHKKFQEASRQPQKVPVGCIALTAQSSRKFSPPAPPPGKHRFSGWKFQGSKTSRQTRKVPGREEAPTRKASKSWGLQFVGLPDYRLCEFGVAFALS
jgi:hypothetical protein